MIKLLIFYSLFGSYNPDPIYYSQIWGEYFNIMPVVERAFEKLDFTWIDSKGKDIDEDCIITLYRQEKIKQKGKPVLFLFGSFTDGRYCLVVICPTKENQELIKYLSNYQQYQNREYIKKLP